MMKLQKKRRIKRLSAALLCFAVMLSSFVGTTPWNHGFDTLAAEADAPIALKRLNGSGEAFIYHSFHETTEFEMDETYAFLNGIYGADDAVSALGSGAILKVRNAVDGPLYYITSWYGKDAQVKAHVRVITPGKDFDYCSCGGLYEVPNSGTPTEYRYFCWRGGARNCGPYYAYSYEEESVTASNVTATLNHIDKQGSKKSADYTVTIAYDGNKTTVLDPGSYTVSFSNPDTVKFEIFDSVGNSIEVFFQSPLAVRYDGNHENAVNVPTTQAVWRGNSLKLSAAKPTRTGYSFEGWKDATTGTTYSPSQSVTPTKSLKLLAQWRDSQAPEVGYTPVQAMTGDSEESVKSAVEAALHITDNEPVSECTVTVTLPSDFTATPGNKIATVKVTDKAGNTTTKECAVYVSSYVNITKPVFTVSSKNLFATLKNPGTDKVTESGFVWGVMSAPTLTVNNGRAATTTVATRRGDKISVTADNLQKGVEYCARAYIIAGGITYYSEEITIGLGLPAYGTFTIANDNNSNKFTVTRSGGTEGVQTVYYRTVNGSAVGGTHFTHKSGTLVFKAGADTMPIEISEKTANTPYSGKSATAYSNEDRTYSVEIYRVVGGGSLGKKTNAVRTMNADDNYKIDRTLYDESVRTVTITDSNKWVADHSGSGDWRIFFQNDRKKNTDQINFNVQRTMDVGASTNSQPYLKATANGFLYRSYFSFAEDEDGYELAWIANHAPNSYGPVKISEKSAIPISSAFGDALFTAEWETYESGSINLPSMVGYKLYADTKHTAAADGKWVTYNNNEWIMFDNVNDTAHVWFASAGANKDIWYMQSYKDWIVVKDTQEPQFVAVAPMAGGVYKVGDTFTVSLIFDEIVDSVNSGSFSSIVVNTSWGKASYSGGADTNVLYFKGKVAQNASGTLTVNSFTNTSVIKDLCNQNGEDTVSGSGSTNATVDTSAPNFTVKANGITNGTGKATITVNETKTKTTGMSYVWSDSKTAPTNGWVTLSDAELKTAKNSGLSLSIRKEPGSGASDGKWYLHVKATYATTGASTYDSTYLDFGTAAAPASGSTTPTLTASANNTSWATSRKISITAVGAETLKYRRSDETDWTTLQITATSVTVNANGYYTFLLTAGDVTIFKTVLVEKIDREAPTASVGEATSGSIQSPKPDVYTKIVLPITYADAQSGVKTVKYRWTNSTDTPTSWTTLSSGATSVAYTAGESTPTSVYLHLKVWDQVEHTYTTYSSPYTVISQSAVKNHTPKITITGAPTAWTNDTATLIWTLSDFDGKNYEVILPDGKTTTESSGQIWARKNGDYTVTVRDLDYGGENSATLKVERLDYDPPTVTIGGGSDTWTNTDQTLTVTADDSLSGVGKIFYKIVSNNGEIPTEGLTELTGNTITVSDPGRYYVYYKVYDNAGDATIDREANKMEGFQAVFIDKTAPEISFGEYSEESGMTVTVKDPKDSAGSFSGLSSVTYQIESGTTILKTGDVPVNGEADVSFTLTEFTLGDVKVTVTAVDLAGNRTQSCKEFHIDVVSVDITWAALEFTYSDGTWNTATHTYDGVGWTPDETDGNRITVRNNGDTAVNVFYRYTPQNSAVTGDFTDKAAAITAPVALPQGEEHAAWLRLNGKPTGSMEKAVLGSVTVTIGGD